MSDITLDDLITLEKWDTPTICNGLEIVAPERRATGFTYGHHVCLDASLPPMIGYVRTAMIRAAMPPSATADEVRARRAAYYEYVASGDNPRIVCIQDLDADPGFGAFWGEVNTAVHKGLGCSGAITNGSMRDLDDCADGFQLLAGKVGPSHAHVHVVDHGNPVNVFGMTVSNGDIVHADRHGAVVIPPDAVKRLPGAIDLLTRRESVILGVARNEGFSIRELKKAMAESAEIH